MNTIYQSSIRNYQTLADSAAFVRVSSPAQPSSSSTETSSIGSQSARVTFSEEALRKAGQVKETRPAVANQGTASESKIDTEEAREIASLKRRDSEVRAHEMAHVMAGGSLVLKGASYQYQTGPDGIRYAVGGEVSIDTSPVDDDAQATIRKMRQVQRAALAPAEPSAQDRAVASSATKEEASARQELRQQEFNETQA
jgi:hypothetical protein